MKTILWLLSLTLVLCLTGCVSLRVNEVTTNPLGEGDAEFNGVADFVEQGHINIIWVHGMGGYAKGDPWTMIDAASRELNLTPVSSERMDIAGAEDSLGSVETRVFKHPNGNEVRMVVVDWSPTTFFLKAVKLNRDRDALGERDTRVKLHRDVKVAQNNALGDVFLYLNPEVRKDIQEPVRRALKDIASLVRTDQSTREASQTMVVAFSLGARIVNDILTEETPLEADQQDWQLVSDSTRSFFMLSNH